jgi:TrmH family RNA methyltransferase
MPTIITSFSNNRIKEVVKLLTKSSFRKESSLFVVDGLREIKAAIENGYEIKALFVDSLANYSEIQVKDEYVYIVDSKIFSKMSYKDNPDGFIAVFKMIDLKINDISLSSNPLIIVLEGTEKPGNFGAIIRTAYAAGADAVICNDPLLDIYNPNVIRASEGMLFSCQVAISPVVDTKEWLKKHGIAVFSTSINAQYPYYQADLRAPSAIVFGSEADGLTNKWLDGDVSNITIPMKEGIDSLNLSVSVGIVAFEAVRQRLSS